MFSLQIACTWNWTKAVYPENLESLSPEAVSKEECLRGNSVSFRRDESKRKSCFAPLHLVPLVITSVFIGVFCVAGKTPSGEYRWYHTVIECQNNCASCIDSTKDFASTLTVWNKHHDRHIIFQIVMAWWTLQKDLSTCKAPKKWSKNQPTHVSRK